MSDSLKDQLLKAGFAAPAPKTKPARKPGPKNHGPKTHGPKAHGPKAPKRSPAPPAADATNSTTPQASGAPANNQPMAGHTHVAKPVAKKKKKQKAPAIKRRSGSWSTREDVAATEDKRSAGGTSAQAQQRRQMKAEIQRLIDSTALKQYKGEEIYRFTLQNKIRELLVSEPIRKQLVAGELAITRLNGATRIIPAATAISVRAVNPNWVIFISSDVSSSNDGDDEFPIPDDLVW